VRVDCHVHLVGDHESYPQVADRTYTASHASLADLEEASSDTDIDAFVIVQPSFYGDDNRLLLKSLAKLGPHGRGVVSADSAPSTDALEALVAAGVRGLRINRYSAVQSGGSSTLAEAIAATATIAAPLGVHLEVMAPVEGLGAASDAIAASTAGIVLDHYGLFDTHEPTDSEGRALLELLALSHVYMKCSAPYRSSADPHDVVPNRLWLSAILEAASDRCLWGSDWPFTPPREAHRGADQPTDYRDLTYTAMYSAFVGAVGDESVLSGIFFDNPARLYGFAATPTT
jgi:predicted TIM-barrel fold metal-dependent hydrolase